MIKSLRSNPFTSGMSEKYSFEVWGDTEKNKDFVKGVFNGKSFEFEAKAKFHQKNQISEWTNSEENISVSVQVPGPDDGLQDMQWGQIKVGKAEKNLNCYPAE